MISPISMYFLVLNKLRISDLLYHILEDIIITFSILTSTSEQFIYLASKIYEINQ